MEQTFTNKKNNRLIYQKEKVANFPLDNSEIAKQRLFLQRKTKASRLLVEVLSKLNELDLDNFEDLYPSIVDRMKEAKLMRDDLFSSVENDKVKEIFPELISISKQIENKYDNILRMFIQEEKSLQEELNALNKKKKLILYQR